MNTNLILDEIDKYIKSSYSINTDIQLSSFVLEDGKILYFKDGLIIAEVVPIIKNYGFGGYNIEINEFDYRNKLKEEI